MKQLRTNRWSPDLSSDSTFAAETQADTLPSTSQETDPVRTSDDDITISAPLIDNINIAPAPGKKRGRRPKPQAAAVDKQAVRATDRSDV